MMGRQIGDKNAIKKNIGIIDSMTKKSEKKLQNIRCIKKKKNIKRIRNRGIRCKQSYQKIPANRSYFQKHEQKPKNDSGFL